MTEDEKEKLKEDAINKWSKLGLLEGLDTIQKNCMDQKLVNEDEVNTQNWDFPLLPVAIRVAAHTIAGGGWQQSKKQKLKQDRLNKLRQLQGEEPNVVLPDDEFVDGLVSVQPLSTPSCNLLYMDFKYNTPIKKETSWIYKIKYIIKKLKNNIKKWMTSRFSKKKL